VGKPPFDADNAYDLMAKHVNEPVAYPRGFDPQLRAICDRCLAKKPAERYASLLALERDLGKVAGLGEPEPEPGLRWTTWVILVASLSAFVAIAWILKDHLRRALGL
jgi:serine/threonine protein kinase